MKTILNIKIDKDAKAKAKKIAEQMGLPLSAIANALLREFIRTREFSVKLEPCLKPEVERELREALRDYRSNKNIVSFRSAGEAIKYLSKK
jgi:addiction module RelB/DinJ family antitoxin